MIKQLQERQFKTTFDQMHSEIHRLQQQLKDLNREKDIMAADSEDRVKISLKKEELANRKKKHKKMQVNSFSFLVMILIVLTYFDVLLCIILFFFEADKLYCNFQNR